MREDELNAFELNDDELDEVTGGFGLLSLLRGKGQNRGKSKKQKCPLCGAPIDGDSTGRAWLCTQCRMKSQKLV